MLIGLNHIKTPDYHKAIRICSRHESFTFDYIDIGEDIQLLESQLDINHFSTSKLKYENVNS